MIIIFHFPHSPAATVSGEWWRACAPNDNCGRSRGTRAGAEEAPRSLCERRKVFPKQKATKTTSNKLQAASIDNWQPTRLAARWPERLGQLLQGPLTVVAFIWPHLNLQVSSGLCLSLSEAADELQREKKKKFEKKFDANSPLSHTNSLRRKKRLPLAATCFLRRVWRP